MATGSESRPDSTQRTIIALLVLVASVMLSRVWILQERLLRDRGDVVVIEFASPEHATIELSIYRRPDESPAAFAARAVLEEIEFRKAFKESPR